MVRFIFALKYSFKWPQLDKIHIWHEQANSTSRKENLCFFLDLFIQRFFCELLLSVKTAKFWQWHLWSYIGIRTLCYQLFYEQSAAITPNSECFVPPQGTDKSKNRIVLAECICLWNIFIVTNKMADTHIFKKVRFSEKQSLLCIWITFLFIYW